MAALLAVRISNFAVIDEAEVQFEGGLTVLTGETGAGKSIVVDALGLLLGGRADLDVVRAGVDEAVVEGLFARTPALGERLSELGLPDLGDEVSVRRTVGRAGRGRVFVNGALVTVGVVSRLMRGQVEISGQHEHVGLFDPATHRELLDRFAGLGQKLTEYAEAFSSLQSATARLAELGGGGPPLAQRLDFVRFQLAEIDRLAPGPGEDAALEEERRRLANAEKLRRACEEARELLSGQDAAATELVARGVSLTSEAARIDPRLAAARDRLAAAAAELEESGRLLDRYLSQPGGDPARLQEVEDRLDALRRLCRKHGADLAGVLARREELAAEAARLEDRDGELAALSADRDAAEGRCREVAADLHAERERAAADFGARVEASLAALALPHARLEVRVASRDALGPFGADEVELHFSANAGEPPRPVAKVASGGEASRLLLAIKAALAGSDGCGCYVLDEADAGVSGATAEVVGRLIKEVSAHRQVLCITHLPQVAAHADHHLSIRKHQRQGRAVSRVVALGAGEERTHELARMLSGVEVTREAIGAAEALVRGAARKRKKGVNGAISSLLLSLPPQGSSHSIAACPTPPGRRRSAG